MPQRSSTYSECIMESSVSLLPRESSYLDSGSSRSQACYRSNLRLQRKHKLPSQDSMKKLCSSKCFDKTYAKPTKGRQPSTQTLTSSDEENEEIMYQTAQSCSQDDLTISNEITQLSCYTESECLVDSSSNILSTPCSTNWGRYYDKIRNSSINMTENNYVETDEDAAGDSKAGIQNKSDTENCESNVIFQVLRKSRKRKAHRQTKKYDDLTVIQESSFAQTPNIQNFNPWVEEIQCKKKIQCIPAVPQDEVRKIKRQVCAHIKSKVSSSNLHAKSLKSIKTIKNKTAPRKKASFLTIRTSKQRLYRPRRTRPKSRKVETNFNRRQLSKHKKNDASSPISKKPLKQIPFIGNKRPKKRRVSSPRKQRATTSSLANKTNPIHKKAAKKVPHRIDYKRLRTRSVSPNKKPGATTRKSGNKPDRKTSRIWDKRTPVHSPYKDAVKSIPYITDYKHRRYRSQRRFRKPSVSPNKKRSASSRNLGNRLGKNPSRTWGKRTSVHSSFKDAIKRIPYITDYKHRCYRSCFERKFRNRSVSPTQQQGATYRYLGNTLEKTTSRTWDKRTLVRSPYKDAVKSIPYITDYKHRRRRFTDKRFRKNGISSRTNQNKHEHKLKRRSSKTWGKRTSFHSLYKSARKDISPNFTDESLRYLRSYITNKRFRKPEISLQGNLSTRQSKIEHKLKKKPSQTWGKRTSFHSLYNSARKKKIPYITDETLLYQHSSATNKRFRKPGESSKGKQCTTQSKLDNKLKKKPSQTWEKRPSFHSLYNSARKKKIPYITDERLLYQHPSVTNKRIRKPGKSSQDKQSTTQSKLDNKLKKKPSQTWGKRPSFHALYKNASKKKIAYITDTDSKHRHHHSDKRLRKAEVSSQGEQSTIGTQSKPEHKVKTKPSQTGVKTLPFHSLYKSARKGIPYITDKKLRNHRVCREKKTPDNTMEKAQRAKVKHTSSGTSSKGPGTKQRSNSIQIKASDEVKNKSKIRGKMETSQSKTGKRQQSHIVENQNTINAGSPFSLSPQSSPEDTKSTRCPCEFFSSTQRPSLQVADHSADKDSYSHVAEDTQGNSDQEKIAKTRTNQETSGGFGWLAGSLASDIQSFLVTKFSDVDTRPSTSVDPSATLQPQFSVKKQLSLEISRQKSEDLLDTSVHAQIANIKKLAYSKYAQTGTRANFGGDVLEIVKFKKSFKAELDKLRTSQLQRKSDPISGQTKAQGTRKPWKP